MLEKATEWDAIKVLLAASYGELFSEEELAGVVAFYKTPIGEAYAKKMPDLTTRTRQLGRDAGQALKPEIVRLARQTMEKAALLGYVLTPAGSPGAPAGTPEGIPSATLNAGVIGGIIGSVPTNVPVPPPPPPPGAAAISPQARIRVGGDVQQAKLLRQTVPVYPPLAKQARITGVVRLNALVGKDGTIQSLTVADGHPLLVPAAMEAVKQWIYEPNVVNGEPAEVVTQIDVSFTLSKD
jgi:protein TonB